MFLSPSQVHFTSGIDNLGASKMAADSHIGEIYHEMKIRNVYPRLQVVKKSGHYFTLDNTRLYLLRRMEEEGHCKVVPVDEVLLKKVPEAVQKMMVLPSEVPESKVRTERTCFRLRRASEHNLMGTPRKVKVIRDTRSVTCSLETGRRRLQFKTREIDDSSESSVDEHWQDERDSLL